MSTLANMGRDPGMQEPVSIDHLYKDPTENLPVYLSVIPTPGPSSKDNHWSLLWTIHPPTAASSNREIIRHVQIEQAWCKGELSDHLTNWGPVTKTMDDSLRGGVNFELGGLTLEGRKTLEAIASVTEVMQPDGNWNCQDWCRTVLDGCVDAGLFKRGVVDKSLKAATAVPSSIGQ